jgi:small neutral amino acid transporter SnatA (MarC family)
MLAADQRHEHAQRAARRGQAGNHDLEDGAEKAAMGASIAVVPLTIPLLTGPATISTVVIYADRAKPTGSSPRWWATAW